jgi:transcriptional regulator with XRE-family HTH domain
MPMRGPTIRSKWLGSALLKIRKAAGLTIDDVSARTKWPPAKISRIENGVVRAHWGDVADLLDLYQLTDGAQREALVGLARSAREQGWWHAYGATLNHPFADLLGLEAASCAISTYESQVVPGLLQTPEYALAMVGASRVWERPEDVATFVDIRTARQAVLTRSEPINLWAILGEAVLRQRVGGSEVMRGQLRHIREMATRPNITIQVLPFSAGASTGMYSPYVVLEFPQPGLGKVVFLENLTGGLYLETEEEVGRYTLAFDHLRASALPTEESMKLISAVAGEL